jgi:hypothetical protein
MSTGEHLSKTRELVGGVRGLSDDRLRELFLELGVGKLRGVSEVEQTWGEEVMYSDVLMILGAERGLWDEAGYRKEPKPREVDPEFSRSMELKICELWYEQNFPLLVFFILDLKFGIRRIDDLGLMEIARMVNAPWLFQVPETNELLEWRLATLQMAINAVLVDRGIISGVE